MSEVLNQYIQSQAERRITRVVSLKRELVALDAKIALHKAMFEADLAAALSGKQTNYPEADDRVAFLKIERFFLQARLALAERMLRLSNQKSRIKE